MDEGIVRWSASSLNTLSGIQVEIIAVSQHNIGVHNSTSWDILRLSNSIFLIFGKKSSVMHLVDRDDCQTRSKMYILFEVNSKSVIIDLLVATFGYSSCKTTYLYSPGSFLKAF